MKKIFVLFVLLFCSLLQANEIKLDSDYQVLDVNRGVLIRDKNSPLKIKLQVPVPLTFNVCVQYGTRIVYGQDASCGYDTVWHYECRDVCVRHNSCDQFSNCGCAEWENQCRDFPTSVMRSCYHPVQYCAQYGQRTETDYRVLHLNFKDAKPLQDNEEEKFEFSMLQKYIDGGNVDLHFYDRSSNYKVKTREFLGFRVHLKTR